MNVHTTTMSLYDIVGDTQPQPGPLANTPSTSSGDDQTTILVVEDNGDMRSFIREVLEDTYRVLEAENGLEASFITTLNGDPFLNEVKIIMEKQFSNPEFQFAMLVLGRFMVELEIIQRLIKMSSCVVYYLTC